MRLRNWTSMLICVICCLAGYASFAPIPNALHDLNRGIESITYNDLNLAAVISCADGTVARNWYAADGRLLRREVRPKTARVTREAYLGDFIFNQNALQRLILKQINTPTGYIAKDGGVYSFVKDYQGNVRQVVNERGGVVQESDYYPYGMLFGESDVSGDRSEANRYRYGGKEYLAASGLNLYDFSARYLDPAVGSFLSSDPMQGDYMPLSPTLYCGADPINSIDSTGEFIETLWDVGNVIYDIGAAVVSGIKGDTESVKEHLIDAVEDTAAALTPGVPAGISKVVKAANKSTHAAKTAEKVVKKVHGNSKSSTKAQDVYIIFDKETGKKTKVGISGTGKNKDGKSKRATSQVNKWNKEDGRDHLDSKVVKHIPAGVNSREKALEHEKKLAKKLKKELDHNRHKRP